MLIHDSEDFASKNPSMSTITQTKMNKNEKNGGNGERQENIVTLS